MDELHCVEESESTNGLPLCIQMHLEVRFYCKGIAIIGRGHTYAYMSSCQSMKAGRCSFQNTHQDNNRISISVKNYLI